MSEENKEACPMSPHKSKIGGQALIEGVMMKGKFKGAMACRLPDGTIDIETWDIPEKKHWYQKLPLIRGVYSFAVSMFDGYRCLIKSADKQMNEEDLEEELEEAAQDGEEPSKFELWLDAHFSKETVQTMIVIGGLAGMIFSVCLLLFFPKWLVSLIPLLTSNQIIQSFSEGIIKIIIFVGYMAATSMTESVRRTYEYHGAEHKTIACFEAGLPLTVENVQKQVRLHPRCGTSFIFLTLFISILVMCLVPFRIPWQRFLCSLCLLPLTAGCSFECIQFAGRSSSRIAKFISWPGLQLQKITTKEPDASQIEIAIAAMQPCIPENLEDDQW